MTTKIKIINAAFGLLGKQPVNSIDTGPPIVDMASSLFEINYPLMISLHKWSFCKTLLTLSPLSATPIIDKWTKAYLLPANLIVLYGTEPDGIAYDRYENYIYCKETTSLTIEYTFKPDLSKVPIHFENILILKMAADLAMPVTQEENLVTLYSQKAEEYLIQARSLDSQQQPNPSIVRDPIYARKFG